MYFDLYNFGDEVRRLRNNLKLTQQQLVNKAEINIDTLRRIEQGKGASSHDTLESLSTILRVDLNFLLLKYRLEDYGEFDEIKNSIESKLDRNDYQSLSYELMQLNSLYQREMDMNQNSNERNFLKDRILQYIYLIEAVILSKENNMNDAAINKLIDGLKITMFDFNLDKYMDFTYNDIELRILMNIALILNRLKGPEKSLELMEFCKNNIDNKQPLFIKVCYNLSYTYHRLSNQEMAHKYAIIGIEVSNEIRDHSGLHLLWFRKGIAEYKLGNDQYIISLQNAIHMADSFGQTKVRDMFIKNCNEIYGIDLNTQ